MEESVRQNRRRRSPDEKMAIVRESFQSGNTVLAVAKKHDVHPNLLFGWRRLYQNGKLCGAGAEQVMVPLSQLAAAMSEIKALRTELERRNTENNILRRALDLAPKVECALNLVAEGCPVKTVCDVLGVARSNVNERLARTRSSGRPVTPREQAALMSQASSNMDGWNVPLS